MKSKILELLRQQGYQPIFAAIEKSVKELKREQYTRAEIKDTLLDCFGVDEKTVNFINQLRY